MARIARKGQQFSGVRNPRNFDTPEPPPLTPRDAARMWPPTLLYDPWAPQQATSETMAANLAGHQRSGPPAPGQTLPGPFGPPSNPPTEPGPLPSVSDDPTYGSNTASPSAPADEPNQPGGLTPGEIADIFPGGTGPITSGNYGGGPMPRDMQNSQILGGTTDRTGATVRQSDMPTAPRVNDAMAAAPYTVQSGDTLFDIAQSHGGGDWQSLYENKTNRKTIGNDPGMIQPGQQLVGVNQQGLPRQQVFQAATGQAPSLPQTR